jgi:hypothetical protein
MMTVFDFHAFTLAFGIESGGNLSPVLGISAQNEQ